MANVDPRTMAANYYEQVAQLLIDQIERGTAPWTQAWKPGERALPCNVETGKAYRGTNSVWLAGRAQKLGFSDERWGTYRQVQKLDGHVRRGEKGTSILYWQFETKRLVRDERRQPVLDEDGEPVFEVRRLRSPRAFRYTVFNAEQCNGLPERKPARTWAGIEEAERVLAASGAEITHTPADRAIYDLRRDRIVLPFQERFESAAGYYQCALHELGHWTGHESRLNRAMLREGIKGGEESPAYSREEMRAEISSMITGDRLNLGHDPGRTAAYVENWVKTLEKEPEEIFRASKDAQDISDYILAPSREREPERQSEQAIPRSPDRGSATPEAPEPERPPLERLPSVSLPLPNRADDRVRSAGPER